MMGGGYRPVKPSPVSQQAMNLFPVAGFEVREMNSTAHLQFNTMQIFTFKHNCGRFNFTCVQWECCGYIWQLLLSWRYPERPFWHPKCPKCKSIGISYEAFNNRRLAHQIKETKEPY